MKTLGQVVCGKIVRICGDNSEFEKLGVVVMNNGLQNQTTNVCMITGSHAGLVINFDNSTQVLEIPQTSFH